MLWLNIVNAAFDWADTQDADSYLKDLLKTDKLDQGEVQHFREAMRFIRMQMAASHFGERLDTESINKRLADVKLEFQEAGKSLPALRAGLGNGRAVLQLEQTVFLQFIMYLSEIESSENRSLRRCEGFYHPDKALDLMPDETRWRAEIPEFSQLDSNKTDWERCGDFFISARGRFCSESCRSRAFQIAKQCTDPQYLSHKQRRYRERKAAASDS
ncbi:MAG TPA: hypothetical protein V6D22_11480 [Candidatus Obscuribacterales bacterium]